MKKIVSQMWIGLVCIILGFMITFQFKTSSSTQIKNSSRQYEDMVNELESLKKQKNDLNSKVKEYQDKVDQYEKSAANDSIYVKNMKNELDELRKLAGVEDAKGPGIVITISPSQDDSQSEYTINSDMLLRVVNELNSTNEAEAISINDERYTGRTSIREVGNVIKINDARFDPNQSFVIKAIGDSGILMGAFTIPGSIFEDIRREGFSVKCDKQDNLTILKYTKNIEFKYIK